MADRGRQPDGTLYRCSYANPGGIWFFYTETGGFHSGESEGCGCSGITTSDYIWKIYHILLEFGIRPSEFWDYSLAEAVDLLESCERKAQRKRREEIRDVFLQAEVQARYLTLKKNSDVPHPWEYYPELFAEDQKAYEKKKLEDEADACRIGRKRYAKEFNQRMRQG
jgi:hypothetical protein